MPTRLANTRRNWSRLRPTLSWLLARHSWFRCFRRHAPCLYFVRAFVAGGGLISYGPDVVDQSRRAAGYVDRILKGEKPADLLVQAPTKYELVINLKTAKALDLTIPPVQCSPAPTIE